MAARPRIVAACPEEKQGRDSGQHVCRRPCQTSVVVPPLAAELGSFNGQTMIATSSWNTRQQAERALTESLEPFAGLLNEAFLALDYCVDRLERLGQPFGRVCALVLSKAHNLGLACYSLSLDALAQEEGALFRPALECLELLTYFRIEPTRIDEALEDRLPKARRYDDFPRTICGVSCIRTAGGGLLSDRSAEVSRGHRRRAGARRRPAHGSEVW